MYYLTTCIMITVLTRVVVARLALCFLRVRGSNNNNNNNNDCLWLESQSATGYVTVSVLVVLAGLKQVFMRRSPYSYIPRIMCWSDATFKEPSEQGLTLFWKCGCASHNAVAYRAGILLLVAYSV